MNAYELIADPVRRNPGDIALRYGERSLTYAAFAAEVDQFSSWLADNGCAHGDRVVLFLPNCLEYPVFMFGAFARGATVVPVNAKLHAREIAYICGDCGPKIVICQRADEAAIRDALPDGVCPRFLAFEDYRLVVETNGKPVRQRSSAEVDPDDVAWIFYTSGTTGRPKGAMLTHRNLVAASVNCIADIYPFTERDIVLHVAPLSHGSGLYMLPSLSRGAQNIISDMPSFQPDAVLDLIARDGVSVVAFMAPTMIVRLLDARQRDDVGALKGIIYGGAPIHLENIKAAIARFGPIFVQLYGQGEAPMTISYLPALDHLTNDDEVLLSAGYARAGVELRIVDENGRSVEPGAEGEIAVRGDVVMKGYWNNPDGTADALKQGWLMTGDFGRFDAGGRLRVLDRRHDTIISGGTNIYPKEIEDVLATHPDVREVIAFGVDDREWGESVAVAIVPRDSRPLSADEVMDFCRQHMASFKKPRHVHFVSELPKNAYGKVLRRELKDTFGIMDKSMETGSRPSKRG